MNKDGKGEGVLSLKLLIQAHSFFFTVSITQMIELGYRKVN